MPSGMGFAFIMVQSTIAPWLSGEVIFLDREVQISGNVQAWVRHFVTPLKRRLMIHESKITQKAQRPNKHHHRGDGAARPSSGMDLMNPS